MESSKHTPADNQVSPAPLSQGLRHILEQVEKVTNIVAIIILLLLSTVMCLMVVARDFFNVGLAWLDDLARYLQIWIVYSACVSITMKGEHISMDALFNVMPPSMQRNIRRAIGACSFFFCAVTCFLSLRQALDVIHQREVSSSGVLPAILGYSSLPIGFGLMVGASWYYLTSISRSR